MSLLGSVTVLQIHLDEIAHEGEYDLDRLVPVDRLWLTPRGVVGEFEGRYALDYHHADHPKLRTYKPERSLSLGFTSHYRLMADHFGEAKLGVAAENIIVDIDRRIGLDDLENGIRIVSTEGAEIELDGAQISRPCVNFTKSMLGTPTPSTESIVESRAFLEGGVRGYVFPLHNIDEKFGFGLRSLVYEVI